MCIRDRAQRKLLRYVDADRGVEQPPRADTTIFQRVGRRVGVPHALAIILRLPEQVYRTAIDRDIRGERMFGIADFAARGVDITRSDARFELVEIEVIERQAERRVRRDLAPIGDFGGQAAEVHRRRIGIALSLIHI